MNYNKFIYNLTNTDHINYKSYIILGVISVISYILCFSNEPFILERRKQVNKWCMLTCETKTCEDLQKKYKGHKYYIDPGLEDTPMCPVGIYEISHVIFHMFIGYYFNIWYSIFIGTSFELIELHIWNCESVFDIICNTLGALIGVLIRTIIN
jgi:hypothetical protein